MPSGRGLERDRKLKARFSRTTSIRLGMLSIVNPVNPSPYRSTVNDTTKDIVELIQRIPARAINPVVPSCEYALAETGIVHVSEEGVKRAAEYISLRMLAESYTPRTWRTHPLHLCPPEPYSAVDPLSKACLDWIFLISSLNFSFWSERDDSSERYGVKWRMGWNMATRGVHTGYWSLVAALNRALEENIPITDPAFYSSEVRCPDALIAYVFRAAASSKEEMPLLKERIAIMRQVGRILCTRFGGSYAGFLLSRGRGTALDLVQAVVDAFPCFRDECTLGRHRIFFWKRAQILVAETWAAFVPADPSAPHPLFPHPPGPCISALTMFADYRVAQILHHLSVLVYPPSLQEKLTNGHDISPGSREEISLRAASIVSVERIRDEIVKLRGGGEVSSVLIDFYLWDLAKRIDSGKDRVEGIECTKILPAHRTRSIWY